MITFLHFLLIALGGQFTVFMFLYGVTANFWKSWTDPITTLSIMWHHPFKNALFYGAGTAVLITVPFSYWVIYGQSA